MEYSVICATRNRPNILGKSLRETRRSIGSTVPIIVYDDASSDIDLLHRAIHGIENVQLICGKQRGGPGLGRNECMKHATTDFCLSLDDDCYLSSLPSTDRWESLLADDESIWVASLRYHNIKTNQYGPESSLSGYAGTMLGGAALIRRKPVLRSGGFAEWLFFGSEDTELANRIRMLGGKVYYDASSIVIHDHVDRNRDLDEESFFYTRNAILIPVYHRGLLRGLPLGLIRGLRWGWFHSSSRPGQGRRGVWAAFCMIPFVVRENRKLSALRVKPVQAGF